ncbi:unnamed protein product [Cladocopium goreaui]|uniref:Uncharacterized protein n=1 Tax=Cladocopium goreaui TaxID=2562237 RepID=A0A9P1BL64_9DINO|nr:unnamed protein product [Cladocopium goreaui]
MTTMTPTRPSQRRRLTSPLHEMDGTDEEEEIPETPVESELVASPLTSASLAQIVRDEVRHGMNTLEQQMTQLSVSVTARLDSVEHSLKDHDIKIAKLEHVITSNSSTPRSNTNVEQLEKHDCELAALKLQLDALKHGVADRNPDVQKTLVLGGLQALGSLHEATQWLTQKLQEMNGPTNVGTYMKAAAFDGSANIQAGDRRVWATEDLPVPVRARKLFLLGLRWQLGQWGFVKKEMSVDDTYERLVIGGKVVVKLEVVNKDIQVTWADDWAAWQELQDSQEIADLCSRSKAIVEKSGKGGGKSKAAATAAS